VLVIDVGGSHVKFRVVPAGELTRFASGPTLIPGEVVRQVRRRLPRSSYDVVSIGYPGLVYRGRIAAEPHHLGAGWVGFDFERGLGAPVRLLNDAAMQAAGSYRGGRMLFLGLGTGLGVTLIAEGVIAPMELGHLLYKHGRTFEEHVGERSRARLGSKKWRKVVHEVIEQLRASLEADYVVVGGGNAKHLDELPQGVYPGDNENAFGGGALIWETEDPLVLPKRRTAARVAGLTRDR
jgi:predicted NBD/HSP70 family sugar kinase